MTLAAKQCREWIEAEFPGVRVSRQSCRLTAGGSVSQHSAYGSGTTTPRDSNAIDIFGPAVLDTEQERAFVDAIVAELERHRDDWSIRLILWRTRNHYGHAHIDFWPTITYPKRWCADRKKIPVWKRSDGSDLSTRNPEPENGRYDGPAEVVLMPREQWDQMIRALFEGRPDLFKPVGGYTYWQGLDPNSPEWASDFWPAFVKAITLT